MVLGMTGIQMTAAIHTDQHVSWRQTIPREGSIRGSPLPADDQAQGRQLEPRR
jgi:hypothetical protein